MFIVIHETLLSVETNKRQNEFFISQFATQALNKYSECDDFFILNHSLTNSIQKSFLGKLRQSLDNQRNAPHFMEPEGSLPSLQ